MPAEPTHSHRLACHPLSRRSHHFLFHSIMPSIHSSPSVTLPVFQCSLCSSRCVLVAMREPLVSKHVYLDQRSVCGGYVILFYSATHVRPNNIHHTSDHSGSLSNTGCLFCRIAYTHKHTHGHTHTHKTRDIINI